MKIDDIEEIAGDYEKGRVQNVNQIIDKFDILLNHERSPL